MWLRQPEKLSIEKSETKTTKATSPTLFELTSLATKNRHSHLGATQPLIASSGNLQVLNHPQQGCPTAALGQNPALWSLPGSQWESSRGQELEACSLKMKSTSQIPPRNPLSARGNWSGASKGSPEFWLWRWDPSAPTRCAMGWGHPLVHSGCGFRCRFHSRCSPLRKYLRFKDLHIGFESTESPNAYLHVAVPIAQQPFLQKDLAMLSGNSAAAFGRAEIRLPRRPVQIVTEVAALTLTSAVPTHATREVTLRLPLQ